VTRSPISFERVAARSKEVADGEVPDPVVESLILDLLEWIGPDPRPYAQVLEAWRTSCPRLPVWEDANDRGFIARQRAPGGGALVSVSAAGADHLRKHRQVPRR
jgi:hypothetical protein